jgi:hypothetical protein
MMRAIAGSSELGTPENEFMALFEQPEPRHFGVQPNGRYIPGRAEIRRGCAAIQSRWSVAERVKRYAWAKPVPVTIQELAVRDLGV